MAILKNLPRYSTDRFDNHWENTNKIFTAEISNFNDIGWPFGQVYDDACDEGFILVSSQTGKELTFVRHHTDMNEGEIVGWWFTCVTPGQFKDNVKVLFIND